MTRNRPIILSPAERRMDLGRWVTDNLTVYDQSGAEWICGCPRCGREKLAINIHRKAWQCWTCGFAGWSPALLIAVALKIHPARAVEIIASDATGRAIGPVKGLATGERARGELPQAPLPPGMPWRLDGQAARYAEQRGIHPAHATAFGLSSIRGDQSGSKADRVLAGTLFFPVWDERGTLAFWTVRSTWAKSNIKTINLPASCKQPEHPPGCTCEHERWGLSQVPECAGKEEVVLGLHLLRVGEPAIVVEGPVDAAVCGPGFVATLGASMSVRQALAIAGAGVSEVILLYDPDEAGECGAAKARALLEGILPVRTALCPPGHDPGKLGRKLAWDYAMAAPRHVPVRPLPIFRPKLPKTRRYQRFLDPLEKD